MRKGPVLVKLELGEDIELFYVVQDFCLVTVYDILCTLHSSTHSGWTPDGLRIGTWTPYGLHLQYNQSYIFHDHPPGVHLESA